MRINILVATAVTGVFGIALSLSACTSTVTGTASPAASASTGTTPTNSDVFAGLNACQVLDQLNAGQGFEPGRNISARNQCNATKPGFGSYALALDSVQGLSGSLLRTPAR
ncbi:hypothetical protein [Amycolatopsis thermophila]|uniref:Uncharacterized protein n=1 Tax=Amycolatopsis thermophila TaxID=206084 RepID=A0ABU0ESM4_9PSEU|nr:hypothetical protein [Amycolatopsis thermophila]MDQ0378083.1 hypothetical protein [Amycolatopsis thermophila]